MRSEKTVTCCLWASLLLHFHLSSQVARGPPSSQTHLSSCILTCPRLSAPCTSSCEGAAVVHVQLATSKHLCQCFRVSLQLHHSHIPRSHLPTCPSRHSLLPICASMSHQFSHFPHRSMTHPPLPACRAASPISNHSQTTIFSPDSTRRPLPLALLHLVASSAPFPAPSTPSTSRKRSP